MNLRDLTKEKIAEALPNRGECMYTAPCIIGTLLSLEERQLIVDRDLDESSFDLVSKYILIPSEQVDDAVALQEVFDTPEDYSNEVFEEYACQIMNKYSTSE